MAAGRRCRRFTRPHTRKEEAAMAASTGADDTWPPGLDASRLLDGLDDAVIAPDPAGRIVVWNPAAERLFGVLVTTARGAVRTLVEPDRNSGRSGERVSVRVELGFGLMFKKKKT